MRGTAAAAALVAALAAASGADAAGVFDPVEVIDRAVAANALRGDARTLQGTLDRNNPYSPNFRVRSERACVKPSEDRDSEDRYCEASFKPEATCGCKEVCHIWGDPHASPFFSGCSEVAMSEPGNYTAYEIPEDNVNWPTRTPLKVEVSVEKYSSKWKFVRKLFVNSELVLSVKDCDRDINSEFGYVYPVFSNETNQVLVHVSANCNTRHENHLNVTVQVENGLKTTKQTGDLAKYLSNAQDKFGTSFTELNEDGVPYSTSVFSDDFGICTDPLKYSRTGRKYGENPFWLSGPECVRPSGYDDGADCACNQQCAAYGDPHLYDFTRTQTLGNDFMADVTSPENRVLYSINPWYSAVVAIDECAYIRKFFAVYRKNELVDEEDITNPSNYEIVTYDAEELCGDDETTGPGRKRIFAPDKVVDVRSAIRNAPTKNQVQIARANGQYFDQKVNGFNTGTFVKFDDNSIDSVPRASQDNVAGYIQDLADDDERDPTSVIFSGGVQAVLKCHVTEARDPRKYFNVCIERNGIVVDGVEGQVRRVLGRRRRRNKRNKGRIADGNIQSLTELEQNLRSAGWCATGRRTGRQNYEHRSPRQIASFPYNPEVVTAEACQADPSNCPV